MSLFSFDFSFVLPLHSERGHSRRLLPPRMVLIGLSGRCPHSHSTSSTDFSPCSAVNTHSSPAPLSTNPVCAAVCTSHESDPSDCLDRPLRLPAYPCSAIIT